MVQQRSQRVDADQPVADATEGLVQFLEGAGQRGIRRHSEELEPDVFESVVDINLNGTMRMCAAARPLLARTNGAIVNLASMLSFFGGGLVPGYAASKGGIAQLIAAIALSRSRAACW